MANMQVIAVPIGKGDPWEHFEKTILRPIKLSDVLYKHSRLPLKEVPFQLDEDVYVWGLTPGKSNQALWEKLQPGDVVIFVPSSGPLWAARVRYRPSQRMPELAKELWGENDKNETWELVFFLDKPSPVPSNKKLFLHNLLKYSPNDPLRGTRRLNTRLKKLYSNIQTFLDILFGSENAHFLVSLYEEEEEERLRHKTKKQLMDEARQFEELEKDSPAIKISTQVDQYKRRAKVQALVKKLADYKCEACGFTFQQENGKPYVEAAHIIPLKDGGPDVPSNVAALCPNCHKQLDLGNKSVKRQILKLLEQNSPRVKARVREVLRAL